jgi:MFS family permease
VGLGLTFGGALTLCYTIGGFAAPGHARGAVFGTLAAAALFGGALSPAAAGALGLWDLRAIFYVDAALFVALAAGVAVAGLPSHATEDPAFARIPS